MRRILIVDDSPLARMMVRRALTTVGLGESAITEAGDGVQAVAEVRKEPFDLVLLDLVMPGMDGEGVLRRIKSSPKTNLTPVIVVSSIANDARRAKLLRMGALAVLGKPLFPPDLANLIDDLMDEA